MLGPDNGPDKKLIYSIGEAADFLGVSIMTLRRWSKSGKIAYIRTKGGFRRFTHDELQRIKQNGPNSKPLFTVTQATRELGVSPQTLKRWGKSGKINLIKQAHRILFPKEEINTLKQPHETNFLTPAHDYLHLSAIASSLIIFFVIIANLSFDQKIFGTNSVILRPISGALLTIISPFSSDLAAKFSSRIKLPDLSFAQNYQQIGLSENSDIILFNPNDISSDQTIAANIDGAAGGSGIAGEQGAIGETGPIGLEGIQGGTGSTGKVGADGGAGSVGDTGPTGASGSSAIIAKLLVPSGRLLISKGGDKFSHSVV